jgi:hypothetical protein
MDFTSRRAIETAGYSGYTSVAELMVSCRQVTPSPGTYMVLRLAGEPPAFLSPVTANGRTYNPTVAVKELEDNWVHGALVLYIGKSVSLRKRVRQYMRFGQGRGTNHHGGRYIWQLADARELLVCWKPCEGDPRAAERDLLSAFVGAYGRRPFANLSD